MPTGRPRQYDDTPRTARPVPSLPSKPFDWRLAARSPDKAISYLISSGATAISIVEQDGGGCAFRRSREKGALLEAPFPPIASPCRAAMTSITF
jgi:hypothetical protein